MKLSVLSTKVPYLPHKIVFAIEAGMEVRSEELGKLVERSRWILVKKECWTTVQLNSTLNYFVLL